MKQGELHEIGSQGVVSEILAGKGELINESTKCVRSQLVSRPLSGAPAKARGGGEGDCMRKTHSCAKTLAPTLSPREREPAEPVLFC